MRHFKLSHLGFAFLISCQSFTLASPLTPDWSKDATIAPTGRGNLYGWDESTLKQKITAGKIHALKYPVTVTGLLVPARPALKMLDSKPGEPLFGLMKSVLSLSSDFKDFKGFWDWLGLHHYPENDSSIPYPDGVKPEYPMGVSLIERGNATGITLSCAACHSAEMFGKPILGMTNRFPRANVFFMKGHSGMKLVSPNLFSVMTGATAAEKEMYSGSREKIASVGLKRPQTLGLDTSLAQVALSLAKRAQTPWAERDTETARNPRDNLLNHKVADSKPAVWWNVKYKTHFLSDGSVISGNPVFTNFLWNEIGRGVDLPELVEWMAVNPTTVEELTTAVFATTAPKWKDYLSESAIHIERAKKGELLFNQNCAHCHGTYDKAWSLSEKDYAVEKAQHPERSLIDTLKVTYFDQTKVKNVGTDPGRREGMSALADALNPLAFSQNFKIVIEEQKGYVPPPLEGIWARYPYFHNNSIPNLCALVTRPEARPVTYYSGEPVDPNRDFDQECVGYPVGEKTPASWVSAKNAEEHLFNTSLEGLSNAGHYERIFTNKDGTERYTAEQKQDLIEFLKTL